MSEDEFTKLYLYMESRFNSIDERLDKTATKEELDNLAGAVIACSKDIEDIQHELAALGNKVDRIEGWTLKIANSTGIELAA